MIGATLSFTILNEMGMDATEIAPVLGAIGNHEELAGYPVLAFPAGHLVPTHRRYAGGGAELLRHPQLTPAPGQAQLGQECPERCRGGVG